MHGLLTPSYCVLQACEGLACALAAAVARSQGTAELEQLLSHQVRDETPRHCNTATTTVLLSQCYAHLRQQLVEAATALAAESQACDWIMRLLTLPLVG